MTVWIRWIKSNPNAQLRLFCFPYAGGSAAIFRAWAAALPDEVEIGAIQLPGRGDRLAEVPFTHLTPLLEALVPALVPYLDRPYVFFGHSMGAVISFELARRFTPQHLFISGRRAPQSLSAPMLHTLSDQAFLAKLRSLNGTPQEVLANAELMQLFLPILRADFAVCETYEYAEGSPLKCPISVFGGMSDRTEPIELLEAWRMHTQSDFSLSVLPGDHFFVQTEQPLLLNQISTQLKAVLHQFGDRKD